jgi:transcriptional regulator with PAS, ATPase and Fis domain
VKLLEALDKKSFLRVGGTRAVKVDIRIIAATNRALKTR